MPDRCLAKIDSEILVASPELCFFQMASELPLVKLIELGYELCGSYSLPSKGTSDGPFVVGKDTASRAFVVGKDTAAGAFVVGKDTADGAFVVDKDTVDRDFVVDNDTSYNLEPLTSTKRLETFVTQMTGKHGKKRAARALRYIADGSASPMETISAILLVLPNSLGGYGFPLPEMNRRIDTKPAASGNLSKHFYKCDLYWKDSAVAAEYDSDLHHSGYDRISDDSIRRSDLFLSGIEVIPITNKQIYNIEEFDKVARIIASKMGRRIQIRYSGFNAERRKLRGLLLKGI